MKNFLICVDFRNIHENAPAMFNVRRNSNDVSRPSLWSRTCHESLMLHHIYFSQDLPTQVCVFQNSHIVGS